MIRRLGPSDLAALVALENAAQAAPWTPQALADELRHDDGAVLGFVSAGSLIGHVCLRRIVDELWILNLATHPQQRRTGIARALISQAKQRSSLVQRRQPSLQADESLWINSRRAGIKDKSMCLYAIIVCAFKINKFFIIG